MTDLAITIDNHLAAYCEPDRARRVELLESAWTPEGSLVDPPFEGAGIQGIADMTDALLAQFPGHRFERSTAIDHHHSTARYGWSLVAPDGAVAVAGVDVADVDSDGKLTRVVGFFSDLAPVEAN